MNYATVEAHMESGAIAPRRRVTVDDLELAATWLENYEGSPDDDGGNLTSLASVAVFLRKEAARRVARTEGRG